ncbi:hypothetical protein CFOL_v3_14718 [Cephalotus follicularis]|uniref:Clp R domain-containing protein n=1 Tax=Cephalotus follicularis TaxID=3775 RepID=A0A1Q3BTD6_CEPFO|nr:hypothetical protein CFOL_v3_14718 [Cephalotus follicularis]
MRAGLSTIQQTLTEEAATVLNHSIAEAGKRNHGQTTPLHVAATLLASPSGFLRQACIKSHPNSSHPLQCRALELCFTVALERLPTAQNMSPGLDPPISNALMAALKRAQAHQRRGCPEQQQQPLLAVKVELEQLIISILDDPSVSRVMREASFSSPAVKTTIEQSLGTTGTVTGTASVHSVANPGAVVNSNPIGLGYRPAPVTAVANRNLYLNPRLQQNGAAQQSGVQRSEEIKRVVDILLRSKKRNPVLVGESEPEMVVRELVRRADSKELGDGALKNVQVIHLEKETGVDKTQLVGKIKELGNLIETRLGNLDGSGGVIVNLGDLKWLVEQPVSFGVGGGGGGKLLQQQQQQVVVTEAGRSAVTEMGKLLVRFGEGGGGRVWLIGTATCETYLRCQVYHPSMENDWDLQAVPIATRAPLSGMFPRLGRSGILSSSDESLSPLKGFSPATAATPARRVSENLYPAQRMSCCPQCMKNYEQELAKLLAQASEKSSSEVKSEANKPPLPQWLQNAKSQDVDAKAINQTPTKHHELIRKQKSRELQKKWNDACLHLHPSFHRQSLCPERIVPTPLSIMGLYNSNMISRQPFQPKLQSNRPLGETLQFNANGQSSEKASPPPGSPVKTDLVLGRPKVIDCNAEKVHEERVKDFLGCISSEPQNKFHELQCDKQLTSIDADSFKKLLKGLMEKMWWQQEAASAVATTVTQCKLGNGKCRGTISKGDIWLLFTGPDEIGKKKMASALSELVCGDNPIIVSLGARRDDGDSNISFRGKTALDRIVEAVRRNPFSVIMLVDFDEADMLVRGNIERAMERGRLADSHGREISLGNVIFILTANWLPDNLQSLSNGVTTDEQKLASVATGGWQLRLSLVEKTAKRRDNWLHDEDRSTKPRKDTGSALAFDLNEAADAEDDKADGSRNSSDLTIDHEEEHVLSNRLFSPKTSSISRKLLDSVDDAIVFKPADFCSIRRHIANAITKKFSLNISDGISVEIEDEALEKISSGVCLGKRGLEEWSENVLVPSLQQLKLRLPSTSDESMVARLELDVESDSQSHGDWIPTSIKVVVDGL